MYDYMKTLLCVHLPRIPSDNLYQNYEVPISQVTMGTSEWIAWT